MNKYKETWKTQKMLIQFQSELHVTDASDL